MASSKRESAATSHAEVVAADPSPGGSELHAAEVEAAEKGAAKSDPLGKDAVPVALSPSAGGSEQHAEAVRKEMGKTSPPKRKPKSSSSTSKGAQVTLNGRFSPGSRVELVKVASAGVLRTGPGAEVIDEQEVDEHGHVQFSEGVEDGARYFVRGYHDGFPLEVRVRGREAADDSEVLAQAPVGYDDVKTRDGRSFPQRGQRLKPQEEYPEQ